jgi:hypothetical protein
MRLREYTGARDQIRSRTENARWCHGTGTDWIDKNVTLRNRMESRDSEREARGNFKGNNPPIKMYVVFGSVASADRSQKSPSIGSIQLSNMYPTLRSEG